MNVALRDQETAEQSVPTLLEFDQVLAATVHTQNLPTKIPG